MTSRLLEDVIFCLFALDLRLVGVMEERQPPQEGDCQVDGFRRGSGGGFVESFLLGLL